MDGFGVLTERYGLKPQGKAAPMAAAKRPSNAANSQTLNYGVTSASNPNSSSNSTWKTNNGSYKEQNFGDLDDYGLFGGSTMQSVGSSLDYDSIFNPSVKYDNDDIFDLKNSVGTSKIDVFASFPPPPPPRQSSPVNDLLGGFHQENDDIFSGIGTKLNSTTRNSSAQAVNKSSGFDVLIPGFGESIPSVNVYANQQKSSSSTTLGNDPFEIFQSVDPSPSLFADPLDVFSQFRTSANDSGNKVGAAKSPEVSSIDELEKFAKGIGKINIIDPPTASPHTVKRPVQKEKPSKYKQDTSPRSISVPKSRKPSSVSTMEVRNTGQRVPREIPLAMKKASSETNIVNDLSDMFVFGEPQDDNVDRLRGRLAREAMTKQRMAQAVAEMNQRDFQTQQEQEERRRIAETLDIEIKRWAAGKEGNLRALLSSLQYVLWRDCGWEPVSLTDLITSGSVKKVYRKATLFVHPDKVQQKGATVEQKYTAEKVFDVLKEAWKKFESEELR